ncbi:MAG: nrdD protein [Desulfovibrio sp.]|nr:nrdD protein [Desulfovibrio sp.]
MNEMIRNEEASDRLIGEGVKFQRIRRITGYLVGTLDRFNNAKRAEVGDRVSHG